MKAKLGLLILGLSILLLGWVIVRFVLGGSEDTWICVQGEWVKHGVPAAPKPIGGCRGDQVGSEESTDSSQVGLANPASVYCEDQGGRLRHEYDEIGTRGICVLPDGTECGQWDYYYGKCP